MNIYAHVKERNARNMHKAALSIAMDDGSNISLTYGLMFEKIDACAAYLVESGLVAGYRVAIISENCPEWPITYFALMKIKCTAVLIDASLTQDEILQLVNKSDAACIITSKKIISKVDFKQLGPIPALNIYNYQEQFAGYSNSVSPDVRSSFDNDESIANIIFSSGTTRLAAGIMHTHDSMINSTQMCLDQITPREDERFLAILPCSHIYGLVTTLLGPFLVSAEVHYIESLTAESILKALNEYKPTIFPSVPKMLELFRTQIMRKIDSNKKTKLMFKIFFPICYTLKSRFGIDLGKKLFKSIHDGFGGHIDTICSAGAPLDKATADFYYGCGIMVLITYGATETNIPTIGNLRGSLTTDTCGKPYPDIDIKISDVGEILIKSPYMMKGYFRDNEGTAQVFEDGWFKTGDIGMADEKGRYRITGRLKENIILATGKKVIPDDVEEKYIGIAGIKEFVVSGIPISNGGCDEIHAFVVMNDGNDTAAVLKAIQDRGALLNVNMKINKVHFVDSIPRTSLQKPKRYLLKKSVIEKTEEFVHSKKDVELIDVEEAIIDIISKIGQIDPSTISSASKPFLELGMDSLSAISLAMQIDEKFHLNVDSKLTKEMTVADLIETIKNLQFKNPQDKKPESNFSSQYPMVKKLEDYRLFRYVRCLTRLLYKVSIKGENMLPNDSGYIICANHLSNFDYLWLTLNFNKERFSKFCCMAKKELFKDSSISRRLTRVCGMIPVDRGNVNAELINCCKQKLNEKWGLLIYPEGTRSNDGNLGALKKGAALLAIESGVPIVPAFIIGSYEIFPKGQKLPNFFNFKQMKKYPVQVIYGKPIYPKNLSVEQLSALIEESMRACALNL